MRRSLRRLLQFLRSRTLSFVLLGAGATYAALLAAWGAWSPLAVVGRIASLAPFFLLYALLFINDALCSLDQWRALRVRTAPRSRERRAGLGGILFHLSLFLLLAGAGASRLGRFEGTALLAEGQSFTGDPSEYGTTEGPGRPPPLAFTVARIEPEFWRQHLLFTRLEADVVPLAGTNPRVEGRVSLSHPLRVGGAQISLEDFSYGPEFELRDAAGRLLDRGMASLRVFPAGARDSFRLPPYPYDFHVRLYPDYAPGPDGPASRSSNLRRPVFEVHVMLGRIPVWSGLLRPGEPLPLDGGTLVFPRVRAWGVFRIVRDPGRPWVALGFLCGVVGLLLGLSADPTEEKS